MGLFDERTTQNAIAIPLGAAGALGGTLLNAYELAQGIVATSAVTTVAVRGTTYTEPPSAQQMRLVSASASDAAAGTGTRTVRLTYYDGSMNGPLTEDVTMNGTTPVNTVATNIRFIEKIKSLTVGNTGSNVGIISLQSLAAVTFATIAATDGVTYLGHHYVAAGKKCCITRVIVGTQGASSSLFLRSVPSLAANAFEEQITPRLRTITAQPSQIYDLEPALWVVGPARVSLWVTPDAVTANNVSAGFIYYEL